MYIYLALSLIYLIIVVRTLEVPQSCNGVARFTFEYLCGQPVCSDVLMNNFMICFIFFFLFVVNSIKLADRGG